MRKVRTELETSLNSSTEENFEKSEKITELNETIFVQTGHLLRLNQQNRGYEAEIQTLKDDLSTERRKVIVSNENLQTAMEEKAHAEQLTEMFTQMVASLRRQLKEERE